MRIAATTFAAALTIAAAYVLYAESMETRRIEQGVHKAERERLRLEADIAVLKAERAFLARPTRIEPAARALGMRPAGESDYARGEDLVPLTSASHRKSLASGSEVRSTSARD